ncbi:hypothetical protein HMPREF9241_00944 [Schaalia turicensis ACS-279-V-Col4]|uniref:Uncharacterized protein n=1 Tax=Schaalia turicensis ACS-279-V-Col4 TaxID=883077 RepID=K0Z2G8_9ACTO|nr:hypothetical protein HMPREF9241_00944 [Schaalia turicensis ACS-279-V-Col4]
MLLERIAQTMYVRAIRKLAINNVDGVLSFALCEGAASLSQGSNYVAGKV